MINSGFTKKRVGTMTLGEKLKKFRSDKRISLGEISRVTRIQIGYLESLEEGFYEKLPADVYVKGFLRSYADFMGVDERALIKLYEKERGIKKHLEKSRHPQEKKSRIEPINISSFVFTPKKIAIFASVLLVFMGVFYLYREIGSFADSPRLLVLSPQANAQIDGNSVTVEGVTDKDARLFINDQPILVNDDGKFRETITMQSGVNNINVRSINKFDKESVSSVTVKSGTNEMIAGEMDTSEAAQNESGENASKEVGMELRVDPGPVWLSVEVDDNLVFSGTMLTGATQTFKGDDKIVVNSGKGNATYLKFNGKDIGALSTEPGAVRGVTFTRDTKY